MKTIIASLTEIVGPDQILTDQQLEERYPHVWEMDTPLASKAVVLPTSTEQIAAICKLCNEHKQSIVVHGGLTNLVGSTTSSLEDIVICLERLNKVIELDEVSRTITVESGVILETIQRAVNEKDLLFPLNFGAKGTAQIGGCISCNAGGMRVIKYGMMRNQILGLEAVLPDGTIISSLKKLMKNNSGYDLKHLLIGSEGTLGIVTKAVLRLREKPVSRNCAYIGFDEFEKVTAFLKFADSALGGKLTCFELLWRSAYKKLTSPPSVYKPPLPYDYKYYVLIESLGGNIIQDSEDFNQMLEKAMTTEIILDATKANTANDISWFFNIREDVGTIALSDFANQQFDISLAINLIEDYVDLVVSQLEALDGVNKVYTFGHLGDGNIHFNVMKSSHHKVLKKEINEIVYPPLKALNGSVSAEHGIGLDKKAYLKFCRTPEEIAVMKAIKKTIDPNNILNPGRIFDIVD